MKYQSVTNPDVIVDAVQFDPHKHPWPEAVVPHPKDAKPKDMTWGYVDTDERRVHVMAGYYIVTDSLDKKHVYERESFEEAFRSMIAIEEQGSKQKSKPKREIHKYRTEYEMRQSLSNACHGRFTMCIPTNMADDDLVLGDCIQELLERRKENPQRDEVKEVLEPLLKQYHELRERSLAVHRITCDGALHAIRYEAIVTIIVEIADKLGIELSVEQPE